MLIYGVLSADNLHYEKFQDGTVKCIEDEIPFELPEGWTWVRLPSISMDIFAGGDKPTMFSKEVTEICSVPIYSNGIENDGLYGYTNLPRVNEPSITISARGTIGFCCVRTVPFVPIVRLITVTPANEINLYYLKAVFESLIETGEGSSIPQLTVPGIKPKLIPIPPLKEQSKIENKLKELLECIASVVTDKQDLILLIQQTKSKILDLAIRGQLVQQDPNDESASVLLERIRAEKEELIRQGKIKRDKKESIIFKGEDSSYYETINSHTESIDDDIPFELPDNWSWARLSHIVQILNGDRGQNYPAKNKLQKNGIPFVSASNIDSGIVSSNDLLCMTDEQYDALGAGKLISGDIVYCIRGSLGKCGIFTMEKGAIASSLVIVRPFIADSITTQYIFNYLNSNLAKIEITKYDNGSAQPNLSAKDFMRFLVPIPPKNEQREINNLLHKIYSYINYIESALL